VIVPAPQRGMGASPVEAVKAIRNYVPSATIGAAAIVPVIAAFATMLWLRAAETWIPLEASAAGVREVATSIEWIDDGAALLVGTTSGTVARVSGNRVQPSGSGKNASGAIFAVHGTKANGAGANPCPDLAAFSAGPEEGAASYIIGSFSLSAELSPASQETTSQTCGHYPSKLSQFAVDELGDVYYALPEVQGAFGEVAVTRLVDKSTDRFSGGPVTAIAGLRDGGVIGRANGEVELFGRTAQRAITRRLLRFGGPTTVNGGTSIGDRIEHLVAARGTTVAGPALAIVTASGRLFVAGKESSEANPVDFDVAASKFFLGGAFARMEFSNDGETLLLRRLDGSLALMRAIKSGKSPPPARPVVSPQGLVPSQETPTTQQPKQQPNEGVDWTPPVALSTRREARQKTPEAQLLQPRIDEGASRRPIARGKSSPPAQNTPRSVVPSEGGPATQQSSSGDTLVLRQAVQQQQHQPAPGDATAEPKPTTRWELLTLTLGAPLGAPLGALDAALSADGKTLAIAASDNSIRILDVSTAFSDNGDATEIAEINGHSDLRAAISLSQDGTKLAVADFDGKLSITDLTFARVVWWLESPLRLIRPAIPIFTQRFASVPLMTSAPPEITGRVLVMSDLHFDPMSDPRLVDQLAAVEPEQWSHVLDKSVDHSLGRYGRDTNWQLLHSALGQMAETLPHPAFVLISGDFLAHNLRREFDAAASNHSDAAYRAFVRKTMQFLAQQLERAFPATTILPTLGNNDEECGDYELRPGGPFLADTLPMIHRLVGDAAGLDFDRLWQSYGNYSALVGGIRVLSVNTNFLSARYRNACGSADGDPGQATLAWLEAELAAAEAARERVWLLYHIPPGIDGYATLRQGACPGKMIPMWRPAYAEAFAALMREYSDVVAASFAGHTHMDDFRLLGDAGGHYGFALITPALSPIFGQNPAFRVLAYDEEGRIVDQTTLGLANLTEASSVDNTPPQWRAEYTFSQYWNLPWVDVATLESLYSAITQVPGQRERWQTIFAVSSPVYWAPFSGQARQLAQALRAFHCASGNVGPTDYAQCYCGGQD
jgi:sphingomyelin phosphodiesterase acid-like 3